MRAFSPRALASSLLLLAVHIEVSVAFPVQSNITTEVPLNETGYQAIAAMQSDRHMEIFIRRMLAHLGKEVVDEAQLSGFATYYSGTTAVQDYAALKKELQTVLWVQQKAPLVLPVPLESHVRPGVPKSWFDELSADLKPVGNAAKDMGLMAHADAKSLKSLKAPPAASSESSKTSKRRHGASASHRRSRVGKKAASVVSRSNASSHTAPAKEDHAARHPKAAPSAAPVTSRASLSKSTAEPRRNTGITYPRKELTPVKARVSGRRSLAANPAAKGRTAWGSAHDAVHVWTAEESAPSPLSQLRGKRRRSSIIHEKDAQAKGRAFPKQTAQTDLARIVDKLLASSPPSKSGSLQADGARRRHRVSFLDLQSHAGGGARLAAAAATSTTQTLPAVGEVLSTASETLHEFTSDTNEIRRQVEDRQKRLKEKMVAAKRRFELKLVGYRARLANLTSANDVLRDSIRVVNQSNAALVVGASVTQRSIHILQDTIVSLRGRVLQAQMFLDDSLNVTDVTNATEVQILILTTPTPTLESFLSKARHDLGVTISSTPAPEDATAHIALLQAGDDRVDLSFDLGEERPTPHNAETMTAVLLETLEQLDKAEVKAYRKLKTNYQASKENWVAKIRVRIEEQVELQKQQEAATKQAVDIKKATHVVDGTYSFLVRKLEDFSSFLAHLDDAANKTVHQAKGQALAL